MCLLPVWQLGWLHHYSLFMVTAICAMLSISTYMVCVCVIVWQDLQYVVVFHFIVCVCVCVCVETRAGVSFNICSAISLVILMWIQLMWNYRYQSRIAALFRAAHHWLYSSVCVGVGVSEGVWLVSIAIFSTLKAGPLYSKFGGCWVQRWTYVCACVPPHSWHTQLRQ